MEPEPSHGMIDINQKIRTCFEHCNYQRGDSFIARVTNIYDLSKFWIVTKPRELVLFQKFLLREYSQHKAGYRMPAYKITIGLYCVIYVDGAFYRARIVGFPTLVHGEDKVQVFYIDYGLLESVSMDNIYEMTIQCSDVPQFAVRGSLAGICPVSGPAWTHENAMKFYEMIIEEMAGVVVNVCFEEQIIEVHLRELKSGSIPVHEMLIKEKHARYFTFNKETLNLPDYVSKSKYPYLYPSHKVLETGLVPFTLNDAEFQLAKGPLKFPLSLYWQARSSQSLE